jgi:hypothetical protein
LRVLPRLTKQVGGFPKAGSRLTKWWFYFLFFSRNIEVTKKRIHMKTFRFSPRLLALSLVIAGLALFHFQASANWLQHWLPEATEVTPPDDDAQRMQVALLLDTSNSMDGLIEQAKSQLWSILVALSQTRKDGKAPKLEMALYEYGNDGLAASSGYVRQVLPFTSDMDDVSAALFRLSTNGGQEYCGTVIQNALRNLEWSKHQNAVRMVFIAGNEGFNQGSIPYGSACADAKEKDIIVNTIFCGSCTQGVELRWKDGATLTDGHYNCMDHNQATTYIETPYDQRLQHLNDSLNQTYLPFGQQGQHKRTLQLEQDQNAGQYGKANAANRAAFKASSNYKNTSWDLVDAYKEDKAVLEEAEDLPEQFAGLSEKEMKAKLDTIEQQRQEVKVKIQEISQEREAYITQKRTQESAGPEANLEASVLKAIRAQAAKKGFTTE